MSKIILHIGTHKTATTTIQDTFFGNRKLLEKKGVVYPDIGRAAGHHSLVTDWVTGLPDVYRVPGGPKKAWADLRDQYANSDATVFLSSEEFGRGREPQTVDVHELRAEMAGFDEIQVVCALRDQVSYMQSIYLELSKKQQPLPAPKYHQIAMKDRFAAGLWLDYTQFYDHLLQAFAPEEIHLVNYRNATKHEGGILGYFWDLLGVEGSVSELNPVQGGQSNVSPDPLASWAANTVAAPKAAPAELLKLTYGTLEREFGQGVRTSLFSRVEIEGLRKIFQPLNAELARRVQKVQPDFEAPKIESLPEEAAHRGKITAMFWAKVAQDLYRAQNAK